MGINNVDYSEATVVAGTAVNLATGVSPTMPASAKGALITIEGNNLRYRDDGTDPTATVGQLVNVGDAITLDSWTVPKANWRSVMLKMNFIQAVASTTGAIHVSFYD